MKKSEITRQGLDDVGFIEFENRPITSGLDHITCIEGRRRSFFGFGWTAKRESVPSEWDTACSDQGKCATSLVLVQRHLPRQDFSEALAKLWLWNIPFFLATIVQAAALNVFGPGFEKVAKSSVSLLDTQFLIHNKQRLSDSGYDSL
jgi:hypothetical protein